MASPNSDMIAFASPSGAPYYQNLSDCVLQAPKAANQLAGYVQSSHRMAGPTGLKPSWGVRWQGTNFDNY